MHRTRVLAGGLIEDELPVDNYDDLTVGEVASAVQRLTDAAALTTRGDGTEQSSTESV